MSGSPDKEIFVALGGNAGPLATEVEKGIAALVKYQKAAQAQADKLREVVIAPKVDPNKLKQTLGDSNNWSKTMGTQINSLFGPGVMKQIDSVKSGLGSIKVMLAGIAAGAVVGGASYLIKLSNDAEVAQASFATLLGGEAKAGQMMQNLNQYAAQSSFSPKDLQAAANNLLAYGTAGNDVLPMLKMLGDVSQGNKEKMKSLALAMSQVQASGRLMGQDANQLVNAGFGVWEQLSEMTGKSIPKLKAMGEAGEISFDMVKSAMERSVAEGGRFNGAMDRYSKTTAGMMASIEETFTMGLTKVGDLLKTTFSIDGLLDGFSQSLQQGVDWLGQLAPVAEHLNLKWNEVWNDMKGVFMPFYDSLGGVSGALGIVVDVFALLGKAGYLAFYAIKGYAASLLNNVGLLSNGIVYLMRLLGSKADYTFGDSLIASAKTMREEIAKGTEDIFKSALPSAEVNKTISQLTGLKKEQAAVDLGNAKDKKTYDKAAEDDAAQLIKKYKDQINATKGVSKETTELQKLLANNKLDDVTKQKLKDLDSQLNKAKELKKQKEEEEKAQKKLADEAKQLAEKLQTPSEKAAEQFEKFRQMFEKGLIDEEIFKRATKDLDEHGKKDHKKGDHKNEALTVGSQEARSALLAHNNPQLKKDTLQKQANDYLKTIAENSKKEVMAGEPTQIDVTYT